MHGYGRNIRRNWFIAGVISTLLVQWGLSIGLFNPEVLRKQIPIEQSR